MFPVREQAYCGVQKTHSLSLLHLPERACLSSIFSIKYTTEVDGLRVANRKPIGLREV